MCLPDNAIAWAGRTARRLPAGNKLQATIKQPSGPASATARRIFVFDEENAKEVLLQLRGVWETILKHFIPISRLLFSSGTAKTQLVFMVVTIRTRIRNEGRSLSSVLTWRAMTPLRIGRLAVKLAIQAMNQTL